MRESPGAVWFPFCERLECKSKAIFWAWFLVDKKLTCTWVNLVSVQPSSQPRHESRSRFL